MGFEKQSTCGLSFFCLTLQTSTNSAKKKKEMVAIDIRSDLIRLRNTDLTWSTELVLRHSTLLTSLREASGGDIDNVEVDVDRDVLCKTMTLLCTGHCTTSCTSELQDVLLTLDKLGCVVLYRRIVAEQLLPMIRGRRPDAMRDILQITDNFTEVELRRNKAFFTWS